MDIGDVLSRAWQTIWKHKILWVFGVLAGCTSVANSAGSNSGWRFSSGDVEGFTYTFGWEWVIIGLALLCMGLLFYFLIIFLGAIGRIGLVRGTQLVDRGEQKLNFGELFNESMPYFWRVFGLTLLTFLAAIFLGIPFSIITCGIGAIALAVLGPILVEMSVIAIVVEDLGVLDGLKRGWDVLTRNLGTMLILWLVLVVGIGLVMVVLVGIPIALWLTPVAVVTSTGPLESPTFWTIFSILCLVAFIPLLLVVIGVLRSFVTSAWTLAYLELTGQSSRPEPALAPRAPLAPAAPEVPPSPEPPPHPEEPEAPPPPAEKPESPPPTEPEEPLPDPL